MCGIAGFYNYPGKDQSSEVLIRQMLTAIKHRGPDERGIYLNENLAIGNVRLSIIDVASGQQPMSDSSGNFWIVFNGEIFNYVELRQVLLKQGVQLRTQSDTEVVVQMYALFGPECLNRFNGQFAICIWDKSRKEMFLARDRVGIRPVYYWKKGESFAFCSEMKGLFTLPGFERKIRSESLAQIFTFWTTLTPYTPFENVFELPPAHYMLVRNGEVKIQRFWSLDYPAEQEIRPRMLPDVIEEFTALFRDAVRIRLRADVPVGAYLSGGLDSSATTSFIHELEPGVLNTFSIGFTEGEFDETVYQQEAAKYFDTRHIAYKCTPEEIAENFPKTIWHTEFPILRTAPTPMYLLSREVRSHSIKVVVTGEGADEFMGGYNIFKEARIRRFWAKDPRSKYRPLLLSKLYPYLRSMKGLNNNALKMFFGFRLSDTDDPLYSHLLRWHNTSRIRAYFSDELTDSVKEYHPLNDVYPTLPANFKDWGDLSKSQYLEATIFMSGYLLSSQGDRMAMGNSVEGRYPFLDYRLIEFCSALPENLRLNGLDEKFLLKKAVAGRIPDSIRQRPKQAYRAPIAKSFLSASSPDYVKDILSESSLRKTGLFNTERVMNLVTRIQSGANFSEVDQMAIAGILSTQLLDDLFVRKEFQVEEDNFDKYLIIKE